MKTGLKTVLVVSSICLISGCGSSALSDSQILGKANQYAMSQGINLQNYEVSLGPSNAGNGGEMSGGESARQELPKNFKGMGGGDSIAVLFMPKNSRYGEAYTFYINRYDGKLTMISKHKLR